MATAIAPIPKLDSQGPSGSGGGLTCSELREVHDGLAAVTQTLNGIQTRFDVASQRYELETQAMQRRVHELEFANQDLALRNAVLEASERAQREDAMRAREERAVAEKKLRRARRVMRDLLDERLAGSVEETGQAGDEVGDLEHREPEDAGSIMHIMQHIEWAAVEEGDDDDDDGPSAFHDSSDQENEGPHDGDTSMTTEDEGHDQGADRVPDEGTQEVTSDSDSGCTVRGQRHQVPANVEDATAPEAADARDVASDEVSSGAGSFHTAAAFQDPWTQSRVEDHTVPEPVGVPTTQTRDIEAENDDIAEPRDVSDVPAPRCVGAVYPGSVGALQAVGRLSNVSSVSVTTRAPPSSTEDDAWSIHFVTPPATTVHKRGPFSTQDLAQRLGLDEDLTRTLDSIPVWTDHGLRVALQQDMAFVYDPIFLESTDTVYLIDWGLKTDNRSTKRFIDQYAEMALHTFFFAVTKNAWFYVGAHSWAAAPGMWNVWRTLGDRTKGVLVKKLRDRSHDGFGVEDIVEMLETKQLRQFAVEVSSSAYLQESKEFAARIGTKRRLK